MRWTTTMPTNEESAVSIRELMQQFGDRLLLTGSHTALHDLAGRAQACALLRGVRDVARKYGCSTFSFNTVQTRDDETVLTADLVWLFGTPAYSVDTCGYTGQGTREEDFRRANPGVDPEQARQALAAMREVKALVAAIRPATIDMLRPLYCIAHTFAADLSDAAIDAHVFGCESGMRFTAGQSQPAPMRRPVPR